MAVVLLCGFLFGRKTSKQNWLPIRTNLSAPGKQASLRMATTGARSTSSSPALRGEPGASQLCWIYFPRRRLFLSSPLNRGGELGHKRSTATCRLVEKLRRPRIAIGASNLCIKRTRALRLGSPPSPRHRHTTCSRSCGRPLCQSRRLHELLGNSSRPRPRGEYA